MPGPDEAQGQARTPSPTQTQEPVASSGAREGRAQEGASSPQLQQEGTREQGLDFAELDEAYERAATAQNVLINRRGIGIDEVLGNLQEADSPDIADQLLGALAVAALGAASGYVTAALTARLVAAEAVALTTAVQSAMDDAIKGFVTGTVQSALERTEGETKATFFASQKEGLEGLRQASLDRLSAEKRAARGAVRGAGADRQAEVMRTKVQAANEFRNHATALGDHGRKVQYGESLSKWMQAQAQNELGRTRDGGTQLSGALLRDPSTHYRRQGTAGVVYVAIGSRPASRPFRVTGERATIRLSGMTTAARDRIRDVPLRDLGMPIVVSGYVYDGFLDGLSVAFGGNHISFGKNENRTVWVDGHDDALAALRIAANATTAREAAEIILEEDIGSATLANATIG